MNARHIVRALGRIRAKGKARMRCPSSNIPSALRRLIGKIKDTGTERLRVNKLQSPLIAPFLKEMLSAPYDNGMDHEPKLVEEVVFQQRSDEGATAGDRDFLAGLLL